MKVYKLRDRTSGKYYKGSGRFDIKGNIYTSKGHIKNSLTQTWGRRPTGLSLEVVTYELTEEKTEPL